MDIMVKCPRCESTFAVRYRDFETHVHLPCAHCGLEVECVAGIYHFLPRGLQHAYDMDSSEKFDSLNRDTGSREARVRSGFRFFQEELVDQCERGPVLSVACGTLYWEQQLRFTVPMFSLDISEYMLAVAIVKNRCRFAIHGDASALPFGDEQFELTYCIDGLPEPCYEGPDGPKLRRQIIGEMYRVTKKGGRVAFLLPTVTGTRLSSLLRLKNLRRKERDVYGFDPAHLIAEISKLCAGDMSSSHRLNFTLFKSPRLARLSDRVANTLGLKFGWLYIVVSKTD